LEADWAENTMGMKDYIAGVVWGIWREAKDIKERCESEGIEEIEPPVIRELINRDLVMMGNKRQMPTLMLEMMLNLTELYNLKMMESAAGRSPKLIEGFVLAGDDKVVSLQKHVFVTTNNQIAYKEGFLSAYGNSINTHKNDSSGYPYIMEAQHLMSYVEPYKGKMGHTTSTDIFGAKVNVNGWLPLNLVYYCQTKETGSLDNKHIPDGKTYMETSKSYKLFLDKDTEGLYGLALDILAMNDIGFKRKSDSLGILLGLYMNLIDRDMVFNVPEEDVAEKSLGELL